MRQKYFTIIFLIFSCSLSAQKRTNDTQGVINAIENYFNGYMERDSVQLKKAFDIEHGTMKVPKAKNEEGITAFENKYFKDVIPRWSARKPWTQAILDNSSLKILSLDITGGQLASAKIEMKVGDVIYIDVLSLQKIKRDWKITNKMYIVLDRQ